MQVTSELKEVQPTAFDRALAELDASIARFQASVEQCCQAIAEFKANL